MPEDVDDPGGPVSLSKTAEQIDVLFGAETLGSEDPRNIVLDGVPILHGKGKGVRCGLCQIISASCLSALPVITSYR